MSSPLEAWLGNILWAIGYTMQSGADTSLLYDSLKEANRESEYKRIEGKSIGARLLLVAFCSIFAGLLADINLRLPLWVGLPFTLIPLVVAFYFKEPINTKKYSVDEQINILKNGIKFVLSSVQVRWMIGFAALLATTSKVWFFTYNPYFDFVGLNIKYYGFIFFLLNT